MVAHALQIYRKAAYKIVSDLGEEKLPEPPTSPAVNTVEIQSPDTKPPSERLPGDHASERKEETPVTKDVRGPMKVPEGINIVITPDNLRDYVGA